MLLVFSLLLADFFDTMGTMVAIGGEAGLLDDEGNPPKTKQILIVDSVAAAAGGAGRLVQHELHRVGSRRRRRRRAPAWPRSSPALRSCSPPSCRRSWTWCPFEAATPALVVVGFLMVMQVSGIDWKNYEVAIPAFLTIILMPFTYSITDGHGRRLRRLRRPASSPAGKAKQVHPLMWRIAALFVVYFVLGPIQGWFG